MSSYKVNFIRGDTPFRNNTHWPISQETEWPAYDPTVPIGTARTLPASIVTECVIDSAHLAERQHYLEFLDRIQEITIDYTLLGSNPNYAGTVAATGTVVYKRAITKQRTLVLHWNEVPGATGYLLTIAVTGNVPFFSNNIGNILSWLFWDVQPSTNYTITVQAYNNTGASGITTYSFSTPGSSDPLWADPIFPPFPTTPNSILVTSPTSIEGTITLQNNTAASQKLTGISITWPQMVGMTPVNGKLLEVRFAGIKIYKTPTDGGSLTTSALLGTDLQRTIPAGASQSLQFIFEKRVYVDPSLYTGSATFSPFGNVTVLPLNSIPATPVITAPTDYNKPGDVIMPDERFLYGWNQTNTLPPLRTPPYAALYWPPKFIPVTAPTNASILIICGVWANWNTATTNKRLGLLLPTSNFAVTPPFPTSYGQAMSEASVGTGGFPDASFNLPILIQIRAESTGGVDWFLDVSNGLSYSPSNFFAYGRSKFIMGDQTWDAPSVVHQTGNTNQDQSVITATITATVTKWFAYSNTFAPNTGSLA